MAENLASIFIQVHRRSRAMCNSGIFTASPVTTIDLQAKYTAQTAKIKERFDSLRVTYKGTPQSGGLVSKDTSTPTGSYFYHSDHLGSSSLITDQSGAIVQHLEYVPFGETFIDERRSQSSWTTPYLFSGKERDEETGLLYFGARYQDSKYGIWYSVDPLAEKYPNISSYVYCADNPVKYVDPEGRDLVHINKYGAIIGVVLNNSPIIQVIYPDGHKMILSDINISSSLTYWNNDNRQIVANVAGYYGRLVGVQNVGADTRQNDESEAYTDFWKNIWLHPSSRGGISTHLNNKYDLMSTLIHEYYHQQENNTGDSYTYSEHASVYLKEFQHNNFKKTSLSFATGGMASF